MNKWRDPSTAEEKENGKEQDALVRQDKYIYPENPVSRSNQIGDEIRRAGQFCCH